MLYDCFVVIYNGLRRYTEALGFNNPGQSRAKWDVESEVCWICFIYPPPLWVRLSPSCVSYVREAPGSVRQLHLAGLF